MAEWRWHLFAKKTTMNRIAFKMQLYKGQAEEYKKRHDEIWLELIKLLKENDISDYSIFLDEETNTLFATLKVKSLKKIDELPEHDIMKKWWSYMATIMHTKQDNSPISVPLKEVFHLP
jgi:L-rhamnose mutarotase